MGALLLQLVLFVLCAFAAAHPNSFIKKRSDDQCNSLPNRAYGKHGGPSIDRDTIISLLLSDKVQKSFCPGQFYTLQVAFPRPRLGLMTANISSVATFPCTIAYWSTKSRCCNDESGVRWILQHGSKTSTYEEKIRIPCKASGGLSIQVASSDGAHDEYHRASQTFARAANCPVCMEPPAPPTPPEPRRDTSRPTRAATSDRFQDVPEDEGTIHSSETDPAHRGWTKQHGREENDHLSRPEDEHDSEEHADEREREEHADERGREEHADERRREEHADERGREEHEQGNDEPTEHHRQEEHADEQDQQDKDGHSDDMHGRDQPEDEHGKDEQAEAHSDDSDDRHSDSSAQVLTLSAGPATDHSNDRSDVHSNGQGDSPVEDHNQHHHEDDSSESERVAAPTQHKAMGMKVSQLCPQDSAGPKPLSPFHYHKSTIMDNPSAPRLTLHWSYSSCVPSNPCTSGASWRVAPPKNGQKLLHVMAVANTTGYVSVGFGRKADHMPGNDVVLGYMTDGGAGSVEAYAVSTKNLRASDAYPDEAGLAVYAGVMQTSDRRTMICFARPVKAPAAKFTSELSLHSPVAVNWALGDKDALSFHSHMGGGMLTLGGEGAQVAHVVHRGGTARRLHGAAMLLAWLVVMPLGIMCARHRWWFGEKKINHTHMWFLAHQGLNAVGLILQFSSGAMALFVFNAAPGLGTAHKAMGIITMMLALLQVAGGVARPKAGARMRPAWFLGHQTVGGVVLVMSWITCGFGILLMHAKYLDSLLAWFVPCVAALVLLLVLEFFLQQQKYAMPYSPTKSKFTRKDVALPEFQRLRDLPDDF